LSITETATWPSLGGGRDAQQAAFGRDVLHRLDAVARQVQQHLLEQQAVGQHRRQVGRHSNCSAT
jgi:hypothetical protein